MVDMYNDGTVAAKGIVSPVFSKGQVAMNLQDGNFGVGPVLKAASKFQWGIARWPKGPVSDGSLMGASSWQILRSSNNKELAWEWIKFVLASEGGALGVSRESGRTSAIIRYIPLWTRLIANELPTAKIMADLFNNPGNSDSAIFADSVKIQDKYYTEMLSVLKGTKPLESALTIIDEYSKVISNVVTRR